jgi:phage terminase large subunit-like protein
VRNTKKLKRYKPTAFKAKDSHYDKAAADFAVAFIENLCHTKGTWAGKPFLLLDWQEQIIRDLFGILKPNGYRQFNTAYVEIPKKNGKSELAAAIALLLCCGDGEERAEVYGCAADRQQASIVFEVAADMVRMCPALSKRVKILASQKRIIYAPTNSFYQVLSAEAYSKHGFNIHGVVFDELHTQPNRKLFDVMTKGSGDARMQPLYFLITTAGTDTHSICYETHQKAMDILEGRKIDPTFYPVIYGASDTEDWTDPKVWKKANPSLGETIGIDKVVAACESARQNPGEENSFRQLRLNQWVKQAVRWMPMEKWDACAFPVNKDDLEGRVCYGGLDLSSTTDITAFVLVFPPSDEDDRYILLPYFWVPEDTLDLRVRRDHVPYDLWERQGYLMTTEGNVVHYGFIEKYIERLGERFNIREIAFDRWGAVQMVQNLEGMGFTVVPFGQGFKDMSPPTKELMKLVLEKRIAHGGHPVLRWMMDNIYIRTDPAGNIKADKEKSTEKIDGAVATIMGLDRAIRCGNDTQESVYNDRGILFL